MKKLLILAFAVLACCAIGCDTQTDSCGAYCLGNRVQFCDGTVINCSNFQKYGENRSLYCSPSPLCAGIGCCQ